MRENYRSKGKRNRKRNYYIYFDDIKESEMKLQSTHLQTYNA